jgi:alkanesulfonate monooxygenase SsuD/methylene tetrahydromethanopterin reductase-like flavin-dependent oxidoreductase (luciferase family)
VTDEQQATQTDENAIRLGALIWPQYTDWPSLEQAAVLADELGYDSLWTWDHLYPIVGSHEGPIFEGYLTLAAWAKVTRRSTLGLMVGANTFRNPGLTAKLATTLDHISEGRAVLGIGGAWFDTEHTAYGIDFGSGFGERLDWLDEAVEIMHGMLRGEPMTARGPRSEARDLRNDPPPLQRPLPILIGGGGEKKTIRTVARFADAWNVGGDVETLRHKDEVLRRWCEEVGRDESTIERTLQGGNVVIRDDAAEGKRVAQAIAERNTGWKGPEVVTAEELVERLAPKVALGFRHIYFDFAAPFDEETLDRLVKDVKPMLAQAAPAAATA